MKCSNKEEGSPPPPLPLMPKALLAVEGADERRVVAQATGPDKDADDEEVWLRWLPCGCCCI